MIRLALMLAAVVVMSTAGSPARGKKDLSGIGGRGCARCIPRRTAQFGRSRKRDREIRDVVWRRSLASPRHRSL